MSELEVMYLIGLLLVGVFVLYNFTFRDVPINFKAMKYDPEKHRLLKKERALLSDLVKDMKENPGHWVKNGYCPITFEGPLIVNDYSCIGLKYSQNSAEPDSVIILFNRNNEVKFKQNDDNIIVTRINGKHAQKFINTVTKIMDERGKELDYFRSRIKERL